MLSGQQKHAKMTSPIITLAAVGPLTEVNLQTHSLLASIVMLNP
jgi:hypothetical protein